MDKTKILIIRRDNIGDLVCTTPFIRAVRAKFPDAWIGVLANTYNAPVLQGNPDLNAVFSYRKAKHREDGHSILGLYWERTKLLLEMRKFHLDYAILAAPGFQTRALNLAKAMQPKHIVGFIEGSIKASGIDLALPYTKVDGIHEVADVFQLAAMLGIQAKPGKVCVFPDGKMVASAWQALEKRSIDEEATLIGIHISARKPAQRWSADRFVELIRGIRSQHKVAFMLFWAPGAESSPLHPGDDGKAQEIIRTLGDFPIVPYPTETLAGLIGGISICDRVICSDGGAMHIAAGLGKPILCFFGNSDATRWHPWGVPYRLLQMPSQDVKDITVKDALKEYEALIDLEKREHEKHA